MKRRSNTTAKTSKVDIPRNQREQDDDKLFHLASLIDNISDALISTDLEFHILAWNPAAESMYGWTAAEVMGQPLVDFVQTGYEGTAREEIIRTVLAHGSWKGEVTQKHKDGARIPVMASVSLVRDEAGKPAGFLTINRDITEYKRAEEALKESEERFSTAFFTSPVSLSIIAQGTNEIMAVNDACCRLFGYPREELIGASTAKLNLWEDPANRAAAVEELQKTGHLPSREVTIRVKSGEIRTIIVAIEPISWKGVPCLISSGFDITERKQAEDAIKLSEARYRSLVETQADIVARSDASGILTFVNDSYCQVFGLSRAQALGTDFTPTVFPEDLPKILEAREALYQPPYRKYIEIRNVTPHGMRWFGWDNSAVRDEKGNVIEFQGVGHDITERKQAEERVKTQLERLASLRAIDTAIVSSTDLTMTFYILLTQALTRLKVDAASILLLNPVTNELEVCARQGFYIPETRNVPIRMGKDIAGRCALENVPLEDHFLTKEEFASLAPSLKEENFTCYTAMPLVNKSKVLGVLEIFEREHRHHDQDWLDFLEALTGQAAIAIDNFQLFDGLQRSNAMLERRVSERTRELYQTNAELEHANHIKNEFLATMSHELRTPLNSILGLSESLLEQRHGTLNEHQQKSLQIIETSGRHLLELINDILDLSKIDAGKFDIHPETIEVNVLCQSALAFVRQQAAQKSISLRYEEDQAVSTFQADLRRMKQILVNLLTNAVKFTPKGGSVILRVQANAEQDLIQFSVIDNGIGLAQENLKDLFQPFVQVDSSLTRQFEGTGLGLALVQKLTDLHGGSVSVESEIGKGSQFTINLPWHKDATKVEEASTPETASTIPAREGKPAFLPDKTGYPVILLAEDNPTNILTVGEYLESHDYEVIVAHNGWEAISRAEETSPSIILMDIQMPSLDGFEATRRLRANPRFTTTPIIALTALAMPGDRERCLEAGANEYLSKPVSLKMLVKTIQKMLEPGRDKSQ